MTATFSVPDDIDINDYQGFVYLITNLVNGRKYIGLKNIWTIKKYPPLKGKTRKRHIRKETDWRTYKSSCNALLSDIDKYGIDNFKFEVLRWCVSKSELAYYEAKYQFEHNVLLSDEYYNQMINCRLSRIKTL